MIIRRKVDFSQSQVNKRKKNPKEEGHCEATVPALEPCTGWFSGRSGVIDYQKGDEEGGQVAGKFWELPSSLVGRAKRNQSEPALPTSVSCRSAHGLALLFALHCEFQNLPQDIWRFFSVSNRIQWLSWY